MAFIGIDDEPDPWFVRRGLADMRVPDELLRCVVFIGIKDARGRFKPRATGFIGAINDLSHRWQYLVTAEHVVSGLQSRGSEIWIRTNLRGAGAEETRIDPKYWIFSPTKDGLPLTDVALCPIQFSEKEEVVGIGLAGAQSIVATPEIISRHHFGIGDEVAILGLFRSHYGAERNVPIARVGNISMMSGEPVKTFYCGYTEAHLIEARSISGLSGSPVFISNPAMKIVDGKTQLSTGQWFYLFGLVHGHFDVEDMNEDIVVDDDGEGKRGINTGIGVVIPAQKIIDVIFQPECAEMRRKAAEEYAKRGAATPDLAGDDDAQATDANPKHREDFNSLLRAAVRKPQQED
jgi:uncharacterized protein YuzE